MWLAGTASCGPADRAGRSGRCSRTTRPSRAAIFGALAGRIGGDRVSIDVPETNRAAVAIAEGAGLAVDFETARMYAGPPPGEDRDLVYGVTTFELG